VQNFKECAVKYARVIVFYLPAHAEWTSLNTLVQWSDRDDLVHNFGCCVPGRTRHWQTDAVHRAVVLLQLYCGYWFDAIRSPWSIFRVSHLVILGATVSVLWNQILVLCDKSRVATVLSPALPDHVSCALTVNRDCVLLLYSCDVLSVPPLSRQNNGMYIPTFFVRKCTLRSYGLLRRE
jgi:hypothetical protein